jgi:hypothetical protein
LDREAADLYRLALAAQKRRRPEVS